MVRFTTFIALLVGGMEAVQSAGLTASLRARMRLGLVGVDPLQRRQVMSPVPTCDSLCIPIISVVASNNCTPSECCLPSFENGYYNCFVCVAAGIDLTDYTEPQSNIDLLYNECAELGISLPILTFPGQNPNRTLSSVAPLPSQTTVATLTFAPPPSFLPTAANPTITTTTSATSTQASLPTSSSSGIRSAGTSCFNLIASAIMLKFWFYFVMQ